MSFLILILIIIGILFLISFSIKIIALIAIGFWYLCVNLSDYISETRSVRNKKRKSKQLEINKEKAVEIIDKFEELLAINNLKIPNLDREESEGEAYIYGSDYYDLEECIIEILNR